MRTRKALALMPVCVLWVALWGAASAAGDPGGVAAPDPEARDADRFASPRTLPAGFTIALRNTARPATKFSQDTGGVDDGPADPAARPTMVATYGAGGLSANMPSGECAVPPSLVRSRRVTVSPDGGAYSFGDDEDAEIRFPRQTVTGPITINGGRNIHMIGGKMDLDTGHFAVAFNNNAGLGRIFVEGMDINVNNRCDVFALRNHRGAQLDFTFQNIFAYGPGYNVVNGNCHGDLIQFQAEGGGGIALTLENFTGYTGGQGFFIPDRTPGDTRVFMRNVNVDNVPDPYRGGLTMYYFYDTRIAADSKRYPVKLENVFAAWSKPDRQVAPWKNMDTDHSDPNMIRFLPSSQIDGVIRRGHPNGGDFVTPSDVGLNYQRSVFCTN